MTTNAPRTGARLGASIAALVAISAALAGCTADAGSLPPGERPGTASVGDSSACPGEFLQSLANARTVNGAAVTVDESDDTARFDDLAVDGLECVAELDGNRKLPSGAGEPTEYVGLYTGDLTQAVVDAAKASGYAPSDHTGTEVWRKDDTLLTVQVKPAERLGIEGEGTYTLVHQLVSEELADIRAPR
jgi:hypothetical protein